MGGQWVIHKHLKREVLVNLIEERKEYVTKLQLHLDKQELLYRDVVLEINKRDGDEDIPAALGAFILVAISLTIEIPIFVIFLTVEHTTNANDHLDANKVKSKSLDLIKYC